MDLNFCHSISGFLKKNNLFQEGDYLETFGKQKPASCIERDRFHKTVRIYCLKLLYVPVFICLSFAANWIFSVIRERTSFIL